jgi:hypothetical protein
LLVLDLEKIVERLEIMVKMAELAGVKALTKKRYHGYLVLIEIRLDRQAQLAALEHEVMHILLDHFDSWPSSS